MSKKKLAGIIVGCIIVVIVVVVIITLQPPPTPAYILSVSVSPLGAGSVSPSGGEYESGVQVALTASPASGYTFDHWGGDASGTTSAINITIDSDKSVIAHFEELSEIAADDGATIDRLLHLELLEASLAQMEALYPFIVYLDTYHSVMHIDLIDVYSDFKTIESDHSRASLETVHELAEKIGLVWEQDKWVVINETKYDRFISFVVTKDLLNAVENSVTAVLTLGFKVPAEEVYLSPSIENIDLSIIGMVLRIDDIRNVLQDGEWSVEDSWRFSYLGEEKARYLAENCEEYLQEVKDILGRAMENSAFLTEEDMEEALAFYFIYIGAVESNMGLKKAVIELEEISEGRVKVSFIGEQGILTTPSCVIEEYGRFEQDVGGKKFVILYVLEQVTAWETVDEAKYAVLECLIEESMK